MLMIGTGPHTSRGRARRGPMRASATHTRMGTRNRTVAARWAGRRKRSLMTSAPDRPDREAALLRIEMDDPQRVALAPRANLLLGVTVCVARAVPIEVHVDIRLERERVVP